ncbi:hypothetical protein TNCV_1323221 [Trichonephila clavipes]|nr:hypothetical protein TNCV_1323221 [Trichonephila clavipes]
MRIYYRKSNPFNTGFIGDIHRKIPEGSELANMVANDATMIAEVAKLTANLVAKKDANLALPPRFRQVLIESPL